MAQWIAEPELSAGQHERLGLLLRESFPGYPDRDYFKQLPQFRLLDQDGQQLRAQLGVEHRVIRIGDAVLRIFGVIDVCVAPAHRGRGLATRLLAEVESRGRAAGIDAIVLVADDARLYQAAGYTEVADPVRWLMINQHETIGVTERPVEGFMVKPLGSASWQPGVVDLLGYLF